MEVHIHLKNAFPGGIGNRAVESLTQPSPDPMNSDLLDSDLILNVDKSLAVARPPACPVGQL